MLDLRRNKKIISNLIMIIRYIFAENKPAAQAPDADPFRCNSSYFMTGRGIFNPVALVALWRKRITDLISDGGVSRSAPGFAQVCEIL